MFAVSPGDELVVVFVASPHSQCIVRVYDLTGKIRQEFWHDGVLDDCISLIGSHRLLFAGLNSDAHWAERGVDGMADFAPRVVFAVQPKWDRFDFAFLPVENPAATASSLVWYRCALPPEPRLKFNHISLMAPLGRADPGRFVEMTLRRDPDGMGVGWIVDENGDEVSAPRVVNDTYLANQVGDQAQRLPPPSTFYLGPLPPIRAS